MIENKRYEILTPMGFKDFESISKSNKKLIEIKTTTHTTVVSEDHPFDVLGDIFNSNSLRVGMLLDTEDGLETITSIKYLPNSDTVYDVINVANSMNYYGDGVVQHNCFYGSTYTLVEIENLIRKKEELGVGTAEDQKPNLYPIHNYNIKIFHKPKAGKCYACGVDVGDGVGANESIISIFDISNPVEKVEQVASFASNKISTTELAYLIAKICNLYNNPPVMVESNNMGSTVVKFLYMIYEYENIAKIAMKKGRGIFSHNKIKVDACLNFKMYVDNPELNTLFYEPVLYTQLEWFQRKEYGNGQHTYLSEKGRMDDHVLGAIWALFILKPEYLEYFFDFTLVDVGLQKIPSNLRAFNSSINTSERDKFLDKTFRDIESNVGTNAELDVTSVVSSESVKNTVDQNPTVEDLFFNNIGFIQD